ncbi:MAG: hypothetical protein LW847_02215 [Burkholderiales bacterium]|jgi:hypothetical protein|nr:hypothetical protein [Burkholderiales bacterium]
MWLVRGFAAWLLVAVLETLQGVARTLWIAPLVGDQLARRLALPVALLIVFAVALLTVRWIGAHGARQWLAIGALWAVAMVSFDIVIGRYVAGASWSRIFEDFNPAAGGLLGLAMLPMLVLPLLAARLRKIGV